MRGPEGADPASVAFDAVKQGAEEGADAVLLDTAGRLHTKTGLMDELGKVKRVVERQAEVDEVLLVLDATTGQNGLTQARVFGDVVKVTGIVLTKLDGTAKGGIVFRVQRELGVPVKLVGLGEGADDLAPFEPAAFVDALLDLSSLPDSFDAVIPDETLDGGRLVHACATLLDVTGNMPIRVFLPAWPTAGGKPWPLNSGDTAWVLASAALVLLMTPGLAFFYGGMVRSKSVLNMLMMSFIALGVVGVLWVLYGFSLAFGNDVGGVGLLGNLEFAGLEHHRRQPGRLRRRRATPRPAWPRSSGRAPTRSRCWPSRCSS